MNMSKQIKDESNHFNQADSLKEWGLIILT